MDGTCQYTPKACDAPGVCDVPDSGHCVNDQCQYTPISCNSPGVCDIPDSGTCVNGTCQYTPKVCNTPGPCDVPGTGHCVNGTCQYTPVTCNTPGPCQGAAGVCNPAGICEYPSICTVAAPTCCGNTCVDTTTDANHCGNCSTVCTPLESCKGGSCTPNCGQVDDVCTTNADCCSGATCQPNRDNPAIKTCAFPCQIKKDCNATFAPSTAYECVGAGNPESATCGNLTKCCRP